MLEWLAAGIACLLAILAVPMDITLVVDARHAFRMRIVAAWLFGLVRLPIQRRSSHPLPPGTVAKHPKARRPAGGTARLIRRLRSRDFLRQLLRLMLELIARIRVRSARLYARIGFDDPADTGRLWALIGPAAGIVATGRTADITVEPDFTGPACDLQGRAEIRLIPLQLIFVALVFLMSPTTLRVLWAQMGRRK